MVNVLILEDDFKLASEIRHFLRGQGFECDVVYDGLIFFRQARLKAYQLYILDINVPSLNGIEVCIRIREQNSRVPVLMLTAYSSVEDKVKALNCGADDYLVKPFHLEEMLARIRSLLRRSLLPSAEETKLYEIDDLVINASEMKVKRGDVEIALTPKEYKLLELLAQAGGRVITKQTIAEKVWDINFETGTNTIEVYISFLRNKIDKGFKTPLIHTRAGYGYYLKETK